MTITDLVEDDIYTMAHYWNGRKREFIEAPTEAFAQIVRPSVYFEEDPDPLLEGQVIATFSEWVLFDCRLDERGTLLERYISEQAAVVPRERLGRLAQVAATHVFSEFAIASKNPAAGTLEVVDIYDGMSREVLDVRSARRDDWNHGTISMRIARVNGVWLPVGKTVMYDRCHFDPAWIPIEDEMGTSGGRLLMLAHAVFGVDGRYHGSLSLRALE